MLNPKQSQEKGFTLIELLVVVAILGILAAVVMPTVTMFSGGADEKAAKVEMRSVENAVTAMLSDARTSTITHPATDTANLSLCWTTVGSTTYNLGSYIQKSNNSNMTYRYTITADGRVTQTNTP